MHVLVPDLHKHRAALGQQLPRRRQTVAQIRQIGMDPVAPRVPKRLHLLRLAGHVLGLAVLHVAARRRPLEVRVEADAVRRVDVDALHLAAQPLALGQTPHDLQRVAQDHPVRPIGVVGVELGAVRALRQAVEIGEQVGRGLRRLVAPALRLAQQVVDQGLGVDLLLDEQRRGLDDQIGRVLFVLAAPDQLRVEVAVAPLEGDADRRPVLVGHEGLRLGRRRVAPLRRAMRQRGDPPRFLRGLTPARHGVRLLRLGNVEPGQRSDSSSPPIFIRCLCNPRLNGLHTAISSILPVPESGGSRTSTDRQPSTASLEIAQELLERVALGRASGDRGDFRPVPAFFRLVYDRLQLHAILLPIPPSRQTAGPLRRLFLYAPSPAAARRSRSAGTSTGISS